MTARKDHKIVKPVLPCRVLPFSPQICTELIGILIPLGLSRNVSKTALAFVETVMGNPGSGYGRKGSSPFSATLVTARIVSHLLA